MYKLCLTVPTFLFVQAFWDQYRRGKCLQMQDYSHNTMGYLNQLRIWKCSDSLLYPPCYIWWCFLLLQISGRQICERAVSLRIQTWRGMCGCYWMPVALCRCWALCGSNSSWSCICGKISLSWVNIQMMSAPCVILIYLCNVNMPNITL